MRAIPPDPQLWLVQPLIDAGMTTDHLQRLLYRVAFESIVCERPDGAAALVDLVRDQPPTVHRAWVEVLDRMLSAPETNADGRGFGSA